MTIEIFWHILTLLKEERMSHKRFTPEQIIGFLREGEVGLSQGDKVGPICRRLGISEQS
jgi:hypothetical protein